MSDKSTEQYILWLDQVERERDELRAEVKRLEAEVVAEHELNRQAMADVRRLRAANHELRAWVDELRQSALGRAKE